MAKVEVFIAGCPVCHEAVNVVKEIAYPDCDVQVYDLREGCATNECRDKVVMYGIHRVPAVVIDGKLVDCCQTKPVSRETLLAAGIGRA